MSDLHVLDGKVMGGVPLKDDAWTTVATSIGTCTYNDKWIVYDLVNATSVDITAAWVSAIIDTLPIRPKFGARSTGLLITNTNVVEGGAEINIDVTGKVRVTSYANPIQGSIVPLVRSYVMPR